MNTLLANTQSIEQAAQIIKAGGLVAFPTETVYGLGADGLNPIASAKIFEAKNRPAFNPLILHIAQKEWLSKLALYKDARIDLLIDNFWPGPLTLVLPKTDLVPDIITAGNPTVAVRMPNHPVALKLIEKSGTAIAAPSANKFGHLSPTMASHVAKYLGDKVDLILDGGKCSVGVESTIVQYNNGEFFLLRHGGLPKEEIEKLIGPFSKTNIDINKPNSPGQLPFHYSPNTPLLFLNEKTLEQYKGKKIGALFFNKISVQGNFAGCKILTLNNDMREAAANLFKYLHEFEKDNLDIILVEAIPETGLGKAIMDRLKKAAFKNQ